MSAQPDAFIENSEQEPGKGGLPAVFLPASDGTKNLLIIWEAAH